MLPRPLRQESFSKVYFRAIAAEAGLIVVQSEYDFGVDLGLRIVVQRSKAWVDGGVQANFQIKSTTNAIVKSDFIAYDLDARTYEHLRRTTPSNPIFLVVFVMPDEEALWLTQAEDSLTIRHCAYWLSLEGHPPSSATSSVRVRIPVTNVLTATFMEATMQSLLERSER